MAKKRIHLPKFNRQRTVHLSFKEREYFTENLALLLKSAVPIGEALHSLDATASSKRMHSALQRMISDIDEGLSLADALEHSGIVSKQTLALVRLGESSGRLVDNLKLAAEQEEKRHMFQSKIRSAMIYPAFVLSITLFVGLGISWFLLPRLSATFSQLQIELPLISRVTIGFGTFLSNHGIIAVPVFLGLVGVLGYYLFVAPKTRDIGRKLLFKIPGLGRLMREVEIAQFGYLLGTLLNAGLPITRALELLAQASQSPQYQQFYLAISESLDSGFSFRDSLSNYKDSASLLPPAVQQIIIAGERSGSLPDVLLTIGHTYEQKSDITASNLEAIIEPVLLVVVWIGVMVVAVSVIVPIYSLVGGLNK
jgi:type II secretory pathway component PulF